MPINVHYCGKVVEYYPPKKKIERQDIYTDKKRSYVYTSKQEIKITDSIFFALENPINHLFFITLTYQWKPHINYGLAFRKKANTDLNRFLKFCRDKRNIRRYVGVLETTKKNVPHYHIILDCDLTITGYKRVNANKKNYDNGLWYPPLKSYTKYTHRKTSKNYQQRQAYFFQSLQTHWNTITKNFYRNSLDYKPITKKDLRQKNGAYKIAKYLTKYFTKELKKPKETRRDFGVRNYFISEKLRVKPVEIKNNDFLYSDFIFIQQNAQKKNNLYWNKCSKNKNFTENIHYIENTALYWVNPYALPSCATAITRITHDKPLKTLHDRIKYIQNEGV